MRYDLEAVDQAPERAQRARAHQIDEEAAHDRRLGHIANILTHVDEGPRKLIVIHYLWNFDLVCSVERHGLLGIERKEVNRVLDPHNKNVSLEACRDAFW